MAGSRLEYLFNCYLHNNYSEGKLEELMLLIAQPENAGAVQKLIEELIEYTGPEMQMSDEKDASILRDILQKDQAVVVSTKHRRTFFAPWMRAAAAVIVFLAGASYWIFSGKTDPDLKVLHAVENHSPVLAGGNRAVLTTSDGNVIILDSMQNGTLQQGNTKVKKQGGLLIYDAAGLYNSGATVIYNTLSTPRGGQYEVILPDGSKVWLNAASSLHFPTVFAGSQREVELTGEAYFEIAKNKKQPFQVKVGEMQIKVIGTHFNVNAYVDENEIKTSLLEGSVKITRDNESSLLQPGQQAIVDKKEDKTKIANVDMNEVMAWKNGFFQFEGSDITTIMRAISRWYDVEIVYEGKIPVRRFRGKIGRDVQLSEVLKILQLSNVKFRVAGKKIFVQ